MIRLRCDRYNNQYLLHPLTHPPQQPLLVPYRIQHQLVLSGIGKVLTPDEIERW